MQLFGEKWSKTSSKIETVCYVYVLALLKENCSDVSLKGTESSNEDSRRLVRAQLRGGRGLRSESLVSADIPLPALGVESATISHRTLICWTPHKLKRLWFLSEVQQIEGPASPWSNWGPRAQWWRHSANAEWCSFPTHSAPHRLLLALFFFTCNFTIFYCCSIELSIMELCLATSYKGYLCDVLYMAD